MMLQFLHFCRRIAAESAGGGVKLLQNPAFIICSGVFIEELVRRFRFLEQNRVDIKSRLEISLGLSSRTQL